MLYQSVKACILTDSESESYQRSSVAYITNRTEVISLLRPLHSLLQVQSILGSSPKKGIPGSQGSPYLLTYCSSLKKTSTLL